MRSFLAQNKPWRCAVCLNFQEIACFPKEAKNPRKTWSRVCNSCMADRRCCRCGQVRTEDMFSARQWKRGGKTGHCKRCAGRVGGKPVPAERVSFDRARRFVGSTHRKRTVKQVWKQVHEILRQRDSPSGGEDGETRRQRLVSSLGEEGDSTDVRTVEACSVEATRPRQARLVACPSCGHEVRTRAQTRVKNLHRRPDGSVCPQEQWYLSSVKETTKTRPGRVRSGSGGRGEYRGQGAEG